MIRTIEWLNSNSYRRYPFVQDAVPMINGARIPDDFLLDFSLLDYTDGVVDTQATVVRLERVTLVGETLSLRFLRGSDTYYSVDVPTTAALPYTASIEVSTPIQHYHIRCTVGNGIHTVTHGTVTGLSDVEPVLVQYQTMHRVTALLGTAKDSIPVDGEVYLQEGYGVSIHIDRELDQVRFNGYPGGGAGYPCDNYAGPDGVDVICTDMVNQPTGMLIMGETVFVFDAMPPGDVPPDTYYIEQGTTITDTFENLAAAIQAFVADVDVEFYPLGAGYGAPLVLVRSSSYIAENTVTMSDMIRLTRHAQQRLTCNSAALYLNDVTPDGYGNIQLVGGKGVTVIPLPNKHTITLKNTLSADTISCGAANDGAPNA